VTASVVDKYRASVNVQLTVVYAPTQPTGLSITVGMDVVVVISIQMFVC
jgi:hypothetical protein